jgi:hypothetical protein
MNDREIVVVSYSTDQNWYANIPNKNWLCVLVDNDSPQIYVKEAISKILDKNVAYVSAIGESCKKNHDLLDDEISSREIDLENLRLPEHFIMTTWHKDFNQAISLAIFAAYNDEVPIDKVVILDMSGGSETERINEVLTEFATTTAIHG